MEKSEQKRKPGENGAEGASVGGRKEDRIYSGEWPVAVGPRVSRVTGG